MKMLKNTTKNLVESLIIQDPHITVTSPSQGYYYFSLFYIFVHTALEVFYIAVGCTPMAIINVFSIALYVFTCHLCKIGSELVAYRIGMTEIYLHIIFATVFLGYDCGFNLWFFGMMLGTVTPYYTPMKTIIDRALMYLFAILIMVTFYVLTILDYNKIIYTRYYVSKDIAKVLFAINSLLIFIEIIVHVYNSSLRTNQYGYDVKMIANTDYLTKLYNRQYMQRYTKDRITHFNESIDNSEISIAIMDIDYFKTINDTYGHLAGDYILIELSKILSSQKHIKVSRWGGEEFLLISSRETDNKTFCNIIEGLCKTIANQDLKYNDTPIKVTASFGVAKYQPNDSLENFIKSADDRLYEAKQNGRNQVC